MAKKEITDYSIVENYLKQVAGEYAPQLVKICAKKRKCVTDEEIRKKLPLKVTEIRTILNQLHYRGIVCYQKEKNKKTGWYSYTWEIKKDKIAQQIIEKKTDEITRLENKMKLEEGLTMFSCKKGCELIPFEIAAEYYFNCPNCGTALQAADNEKENKKIKKIIKQTKEEITSLEKTYA